MPVDTPTAPCSCNSPECKLCSQLSWDDPRVGKFDFFPYPQDDNLRDKLAMAALQGILASGKATGDRHETALIAYDYAEQMLQARK